MGLDIEVKRYLSELRPVAQALLATEEFSLSVPVGLLRDGTVVATTLTGLGTLLPTSSALAHHLLSQFLPLKLEKGFDHAFEMFSTDAETGAEFLEVWEEATKDVNARVLLTTNDQVAFAAQAKKGWEGTPRKLLVVSVRGEVVTSGLVTTDLLAVEIAPD